MWWHRHILRHSVTSVHHWWLGGRYVSHYCSCNKSWIRP